MDPLERATREADELRETLEAVEREVAIVYCEITGGRISKCNTDARTVIAVADDCANEAARERDREVAGRLLNVARGCHDYGGGYRHDDDLSRVYHHGIQTVINALVAAEKNNPNDTQVNALEAIGSAAIDAALAGKEPHHA